MTPRERVFNRLQSKPVDRIPNLNIIMLFAADFIGAAYKSYVTDYRYLVEGNIKCCEEFGIDMVSAISDPFRETNDFGANVFFPENDVPICTDYFIKSYKDIEKLLIKNPLKTKRMLDRVKAIELYKNSVGNDYPILGWVEGPISEAANLRGVNNIMLDLNDNPDFVKELFEICTEQAIEFGIAQIKAGADFIGVGDAAASLIGPDCYNNFVLPYEQKLFKVLKREGAKIKLHICGNTSSLLNFMLLSGADIIDIDWMVDFKKAVKILSNKCSVCGNFDPVRIALNGTLDDVEKAVMKCVNASNKNTFIAAGCEIPRNTPYINMLKINNILKNFC
ncbi:MAG: uroporphyrinogen decarboxylase family protein [Actinomycetota bacterium]|nr:uroporphyrinogen decarboxylase family protein [Actinomycetota bacterium]